MDFTQTSYWLFFALACAMWRLLPFRLGKLTLLVASYVFYGWWNVAFLIFIALSTAVDFYCAHLISTTEGSRRRAYLLVSLVSNLGLLASLKYTPLAVVTLGDLSLLPADGARAWASVWVIPVGISFYTFQSLSYTVDVYRGRLTPTESLSDFALYVAFFPQLVAGPIVRASTFLPYVQTDPRRRISFESYKRGLFEIVLGLFFKMHVADLIAPDVAAIFDAESIVDRSSLEVAVAIALFGGQIFGDFAGYSWIAIGCARILGFEFPANFRTPYSATSLSDFWRNWHISLSTWLRDYLYIPLGGNRYGTVRTYFALMMTMLLGGLWHGASWTFLVWGAIHGGALAVERALRTRMAGPRLMLQLGGWIWSMTVVFAAWVFFRAATFRRALELFDPAQHHGTSALEQLWPLVPLMPIVAWHAAAHRRFSDTALALVFGAMLAFMVYFERSAAPRFIYFQF